MDAAVAGGGWELAVPLILLAIMVCMGMELSLADFRRVLAMPRAAAVGLAGQMLALPAVGLAFAHWPGFSPEIALGVVILVACPGGATSNIFSYLARANTALSVTLTALSCALCFATIPLWIGVGVALFGADLARGGAPPELPLGATAARLFFVTLLPVVVGMGVRARWPAWSARASGPLRRAMAALMGAAIAIILWSEREGVVSGLASAAGGALVLVSGMLVVGYALARAARLGARDAFTISIEIGLQNGALATLIVVDLLERPELLIFPGAYVVLSFVPVVAWVLAMRRRVLSG